MDDGSVNYERKDETYGVESPRGFFTNHHWNEDGTIGERVTKETATHVCRVHIVVEPVE